MTIDWSKPIVTDMPGWPDDLSAEFIADHNDGDFPIEARVLPYGRSGRYSRDGVRKDGELVLTNADSEPAKLTRPRSMREEIEALRAESERLRAALSRIATPHDCGCKPCRGDCMRGEDALKEIIDNMQDTARSALK